jgi:homoserine kinase type II
MAVYTQVSPQDITPLLQSLQLGELHELTAIKGGIENTNYFLTTSTGQYVLTLFERLRFDQLPFYLYLMKHLAKKGIPVPEPMTNEDGKVVFTLKDKPTAVVTRLQGQSVLVPELIHCEQVGSALAKMHLTALDFKLFQPNFRSLEWWNQTTPQVLAYVNADQSKLLNSELAFQNHLANLSSYRALPQGPVHADLFKDNVMFEDRKLTGFFDFYFAGVDTWLFDIAVCLNDWCTEPSSGAWNIKLCQAFLKAYQAVRPLTRQERSLINPLLRSAAFRFWLSRLWDFYLPRKASLLQPHDPSHFERILNQRILNPLPI